MSRVSERSSLSPATLQSESRADGSPISLSGSPPPAPPTLPESGWTRWRAGLFSLLSLGAILLLMGLLGAHLMGMRIYVITGISMSETVPKGSLAFSQPKPVAQLRAGDVITYRPPPGAGPSGLVTHRIARVQLDPKTGERVFRTKGDHNQILDPWTFTLPQQEQATLRFHLPHLGWAFAALGLRWVRMLMIGLPALLIAASCFRSLRLQVERDSYRGGLAYLAGRGLILPEEK